MFLINGELTEHLPAQDRGLHYGDGLFETIAVHSRNLLCWEKHYQRLKTGCERLAIKCPQAELLHSEAGQLIKDSERAILKIMVTRGSGGRGYRPLPDDNHPTRILASYPWPDHPEAHITQGIRVRFCDVRLGRNPALAGIKHLNRLEQILARAEWNDPQIAEGLMLDTEDNIIEGTMSNLFAITGNTLITPDINECGIAGIVRECILELAPGIGLKPQITTFSRSTLLNADEIFVCNSIIGVWPVSRLESNSFKPGPWTQKIRQTLIDQAAISP